MRSEPQQVSPLDRRSLWSIAVKASEATDSRVECYVGLRLFARFLGRAAAGVGLATGFLQPGNPSPTVQEEVAALADQFRRGVEEVLLAEERPGRRSGYQW